MHDESTSQDVSPTAQSHLLYTRFATVAATLSPLLSELERRAAAHPASLSALLDECHAAYFSARRSLLVARIAEEVKGLEPGRAEVVELVSHLCFHYLSTFLRELVGVYGLIDVCVPDTSRMQLS